MNNTTKIVTIRLTDEIHKALKLKVLEKDTTIQQYLTELIRKDLNIISEKDEKMAKATLYDENNCYVTEKVLKNIFQNQITTV